MRRALLTLTLGVLCLSLVGFFSPWWFLGFLPIGAALTWAGYEIDFEGGEDGKPSSAPNRHL